MKINLTSLDKKMTSILRLIGPLAQKQKSSAYAVGGVVRDVLLKRRNLDCDVVVEGDGIRLAEVFAKRMKGYVTKYPFFKTATVVLPDGLAIDFATARREIYTHPGALPEVFRSDINDDLFRRDFTVNAMALSIMPDTFGELVDPYGGWDDLKCKKIRVLHDVSFLDDPTRMLRAVRFEQRLKFNIEPETLRLLQEALNAKAICFVKPQRYFGEVKKVLQERDVSACLGRLQELKFFYVPALNLEYNQRVAHTLGAIQQAIGRYGVKGLEGIEPWLIVLMAIHDESRADDLEFALGQLGVSRRDKEKMIASLSFPKVLAKLSYEGLTPAKAYQLLKPYALDVLIFFRSKANALAKQRIDRFVAKSKQEQLKLANS